MPDHSRLFADPNFRALWEEGPLALHLRALETRILSPLTDPLARQRMCDERRGILSVLEYVQREATGEVRAAKQANGDTTATPRHQRLRMMRKSVL